MGIRQHYGASANHGSCKIRPIGVNCGIVISLKNRRDNNTEKEGGGSPFLYVGG